MLNSDDSLQAVLVQETGNIFELFFWKIVDQNTICSKVLITDCCILSKKWEINLVTNCLPVRIIVLSKEVEYLFRVWMNFVKSCNKKKTTTLSNNKTLTAVPAAEEGLGMGHVIHHHHRHATTYLSRKIDKKIKGKQMEERKSFKAETIKRLSPMSKCYSFRLSRAFKIQKLLLSTNYGGSTFHGPSTLKSIWPTLYWVPVFRKCLSLFKLQSAFT